MTFKDWLRASRKDKDMTLQQVADLADTSKSYVYEVESGKAEPTIGKASKLANAVGYKLSTALRKCGM